MAIEGFIVGLARLLSLQMVDMLFPVPSAVLKATGRMLQCASGILTPARQRQIWKGMGAACIQCAFQPTVIVSHLSVTTV
jgi:hypothetical protein